MFSNKNAIKRVNNANMRRSKKSRDDKKGALEREGRVEESIDYLKQFVELAEKSGQEHAYSKACHNLGNIYNTLGKYDEATKYFDKAYNLSRAMGKTASINVNQVQFGVAMAHKMLQGVGHHIVVNHLPALERMIEWKSSRVDDFDKPFPEPKIETPKPSRSQSPIVKEQTDVSETSETKDGSQGDEANEEMEENAGTQCGLVVPLWQ